MVLLLGSTSSGKTLILKRLQSYNFNVKGGIENLDNAPATIPTVGTNMVNIIAGRRNEIMVRELGGSMAPIWNKYFKDSSAIVFVVDTSNHFQISSACIQLLALISSPDVHIPIAIVFNKIDALTVMSLTELDSVFRLDSILDSATQDMSVFNVSAKTGKGLDKLLKWITEHHVEKINTEL